MRRLLSFTFISLFLFLAGISYAEIVDRIIAIVNDDIITLKDLEKYIKIEKHGRYVSINEYYRNIQLKEKIDHFIDDLLIRQQAKKFKIEVTDKDVDLIIENIKKQHLITDQELREQLKKENIDYKDFYNGLRINQLRNRVLSRAIAADILVTEDNLRDYYNKHLDEFREDEYKLQQIFISNKKKDANKVALMAYSLLQEGKAFEDVAREFSDDPTASLGGDLGYVKKDDLIPELKEALSVIIPGTYTHVIRTPYGFHILKLLHEKKGDLIPYEQVKARIHERIVQIESEKRYKEFIEKLRKSSYIEVKI
ncbi:MAG TPA: peptidylprolyl isomerase [Syntrophorhabdaceae bacterium]|nr:peptidylprolyl isomerase [Syntrophorhabdaceae bacterium]HOL06136.1 peptidylprolyl isomerase [Syntrophorhabdaceae bacterium]HPP41513.1 peptidylprolyl isomerase [Syntrophorhabdaceae bacterium]